ATAQTLTIEQIKEAAQKNADVNNDGQLSDEAKGEDGNAPENASDEAWITEKVLYDFYVLDCANEKELSQLGNDDPKKAMASCSAEGDAKYILGPSEIEGTSITQASSAFDNQGGRGYIVNISFDNKGADIFAEVTKRLVELGDSASPRNQFAVVLDGKVISAASPSEVISGGNAQISGGNFTKASTQALANKLSFGSLPLQFSVLSDDKVSATLGSESLKAGLYAGAIGILPIVFYLLWQYRGLGIIAIGSITLAIGLSYFTVSLLSWLIGMRLSLAGVVALIISIGITADSFIVFFERIRDELREGRPIVSAVSHGWERAKRTVIVADSVNLLAAVVLYYLAVGSVRGFAFTLGLTTLLDLVIILLFTYPLMDILVKKTRFFGEGKKLSGLDASSAQRVATYRGRDSFVAVETSSSSSRDVDSSEPNMSLAERRARARRKTPKGVSVNQVAGVNEGRGE
ncbi:MAG: protein translocase subunit SecD, partial [Actinomycetaceae bacterium]|nr:protein translocase subunit SecD [Actinomycetaceae bacterium]